MSAPSLNALRALEAVARLGSFRAAAETLFVSQSAISHQIRNVEQSLGRPLFEREGNRTRLLPVGADLGRSLSVAFAEIDAACDRARSRKSSRSLIIAAIPSVATCWLIPRLSRFRAAHPEIKFHIVYAIHGHDINFNDVDLAFVFSHGKPVLTNVECHLFLSGQSVPVCNPALLRSLGHPPISKADYYRLGLLHDRNSSGWTTWLQDLENTAPPAENAQTPEGATFEDFNLLRAAALSGHGVALCSLAMIKPDIESGNLVQVSERILADGYDYYLLSTTSADPLLIRQARVFRDWAMGEREKTLAA